MILIKRCLISLIFLFVIVILFGNPSLSSAHVLETDGSIGAVLHIDPDDEPKVGEPSTFFFAIKDKQNKFSFEKCDCKVIISENGKIIEKQTISQPTYSFIFPQKGLYKITLTGQPYTPNNFQAFSLTYDIRLEKEAKELSKSSYGVSWYFITGIILIGIVYLFIKRLKKGGVHEKNIKNNAR